jgi:hypothetical protein
MVEGNKDPVADTAEIIKEVRKLMKFYQELGFEYLPVSLGGIENLTALGKDRDFSVEEGSARSNALSATDRAESLKALREDQAVCGQRRKGSDQSCRKDGL